MRGADVASDHHLVLAVLKVKLRKAGSRKIGRQQFATEKLQDPKVKSSFIVQLKNRFQALSDQSDMQQDTDTVTDEINTKWEQAKQTYLETSKKCLGFKQKDRKEWITDDTWQAIDIRKGAKKKVMESKSDRLKESQYRDANKAVKRKT